MLIHQSRQRPSPLQAETPDGQLGQGAELLPLRLFLNSWWPYMATTLGIIPALLDHKAESVPANLFSQDDTLDGLLDPLPTETRGLEQTIKLNWGRSP